MDPSTQLHHPQSPPFAHRSIYRAKMPWQSENSFVWIFSFARWTHGHDPHPMFTGGFFLSPFPFRCGVYRLVVAVTENKRVSFNIKCWTWRRTMWIEWKIFRANDDDGAFVWIRFGWQKCNDWTSRVECKWLFGSFFLLLHIRFFSLWNFEIKLDRIWFGIRCYPVAASLTNLLLFRRSERLEL